MSDLVIKHKGEVHNGVRTYYEPELHKRNLESIEAQGGKFTETLRVTSKRISNDTYAYFFGGIVKTALQFNRYGGWGPDEFRKYYEDMFLSEEKCFIIQDDEGMPISQKIVKMTRSISDCNQKEMNVFCEQVIADLAMQGIVILSPEQYYLEKYKTITHGPNRESDPA